MRILLVEDERSLAKEIHDFLQSEHHVLDEVRTKKAASENLAVNSYDFVLLDLGLPDGLEIHLNEPLISFEGQEIKLTKKEYILLQFMLINKNRVLNRFQLAEHLWGDHLDDDYQSNYIDVHVKNIRKKLGAFGPVDWLETVRGLGYKVIA